MNKDPFDYLQPYIVALGLSEQAPIGSGTLVRFLLDSILGITVYAVLTATHILEELGCLQSYRDQTAISDILLSKPINRLGDVVGVKWSNFGFGVELDLKHYRHLNGFHNGIYQDSERDVSFLILGIGNLPKCDLTSHSSFFDLDSNSAGVLTKKDDPYVFYKGACLDSEREEGVLINTGVRVVFHDQYRTAVKSKIKLIDAWSLDNYSFNGASGGGLWRFYRAEKNGDLKYALHGVIVERNKKMLRAIEISYLYNKVLPKLKTSIITSLL